MRGSKAESVFGPGRARILPPRKRRPSLNGDGQGAKNRGLAITLVMVLLLLGATYGALPASQHQLSPVAPTHASLHGGATGEGPSSDSRTVHPSSAYLDVRPTVDRFGGPSGEAVNITFDIRELNNIDVMINSFTWRFTTLDDKGVVDGIGTVPLTIDLEGLGSTEWTTSITISSRLYREMMLQGRDQLRLALTFRGTDANYNDLTSSQTVPAHLSQRVAVLVDEDVYPLIKAKLLRFEEDANLRGSAEFIHRTGNWGDAAAVRSLLKQLWRDEAITGAILWGHLPFAMWDMVHSDEKHEIFPIPVFYEDMDGSFADTNGDGLYDKHYWGENDGCEIWTSFVMPPRELVPEENLDPSGQGTGGGLSASYYNSRNQVNWRMNRVDPTLDFYWLEDLPQEIDDDDFSVKWTGRIKADASETYTLSPLHGGGLRIWIDGNLVHDYWSGTTWKKWERMSTVYMTKGWHNIRIEYNNNNWGFNGAVRLLWTSDHVLAGTLNEWLDRSHAYHQGALEYNDEALLFMDYGYGIKCNMMDPILNKHVKPLYGDRVVVKGCTNTTSGDDYIEALRPGYELISVWSHAGSASHWISYEGMPDDVNGSAPSYKIRETQGGLVTLIWGCHAGDFGGSYNGEEVSFLSDNLAANYAFSTPYGLACAAATRSIGTTFREVYWAWDNASSLATGFAANLEVEYDRATIERIAPNIAQDMWVKDVVLMGDPFLRIDHRPWNLSLTIDDDADFTSDTTVDLQVSANEGEEMRFKNAGGTWSPWEAFCSTKEWVLGDSFGGQRVHVQVRNGWGPASYGAYDVITRVATMSDHVALEINDGATMTNSTDLTLSLDIGDADPGMVWMSLRDEKEAWTDWMPFLASTSWSLSTGDGDRSVIARFMGDDGIWRAEASDSITVDTRPPSSSHVLNGTLGSVGWYVSTVTVILDATDDLTGVDMTEWSLDGGTWTQYILPIEVEGDGPHQLSYRSWDVCGNVEPVNDLDLKVDTLAPEGLVIGTLDGVTRLSLPSLTVTMDARDVHSGLDVMRFAFDGEEWGPWIAFGPERFLMIPSEDGNHTIDWQVRDMAGNVATVPQPLVVVLDTISPGVDSTSPTSDDVEVPVDAEVVVNFDEPIDPLTISVINVLVQDEEGVPVTGTLDHDEELAKVTFSPDDPFEHYTKYTVLLRGEITDMAGNALNGGSGHIWSFTTVGLPPSAPRSVSSEATNTSLVLSWLPPEELGSGDFQGYNVYRMRDDAQHGQDFEFRSTVTGTGFVDEDVEDGVQYHYMIRAYSSYAEGPDSQVVSGMVIPDIEDPDGPEDPVEPGPGDPDDDERKQTSGTPTWLYLVFVVVAAMAIVMVLFTILRRREP